MTDEADSGQLVDFDISSPIWGRCFTVAPLVLIGTRDEGGALDLAPKHMATPMGWQNYFGFVCSPAHQTYSNIQRSGEFTVSYPKPSQVLFASLAASPRQDCGDKAVLKSFDTFTAEEVDGEFMQDSYLFLECRHFKTVEGFGDNCLITGEIVRASADPDYVRGSELDDQELILDSPLLGYLAPGRFASISRSNAFPFPADMKR